jgi:polysaccharide deacetylase 2 family uncharacterized protein YibQ
VAVRPSPQPCRSIRKRRAASAADGACLEFSHFSSHASIVYSSPALTSKARCQLRDCYPASPNLCRSATPIVCTFRLHRRFVIIFPILIAITSVFLAGCEKTSIRKSQFRTVTDEIVAAAQKTVERKSEVTVHRGSSGKLPLDTVYVSLNDLSEELALQRALAEIAQLHKLSIVEVSSGGINRFDFAFNGTRTHTVRVVTRLAGRLRPLPPAARASGSATLAIIIDDLGNDRSAADAVIAIPFPLTISVLPHLPFSAEIAEEAHLRGDQVLLHLPMQAESIGIQSEQTELRVGMNPQQVQTALAGMLDTVPDAVGVNNHEGSRATSDPALMAALMPALRDRHLFFVDSRTSASTVAYHTALRSGVAAASRKVFLDDAQTRDAIIDQLKLAARDATRDGSAIAIGHPHPSTIAALAEGVPWLETQGVRLVFASDLVH